MTDEISRRSPRILIRKNTPHETRENWQYIKKAGSFWIRLIMALIALAMVIPLTLAIYSRGYFDGSQAMRAEISTKESTHVR